MRRRCLVALSLALGLLALSGHARSPQRPRHSPLDEALAEVLVQKNGDLVARGSAIVVATRREAGEPVCYLLTAGHVLAPGGTAAHVTVVLPSDREGPRVVAGEAIRQVDGEDGDLAVLRAAGAECRRVHLDPRLEPDGHVWLAGFPQPGTPDVWAGHVRDTAAGAARWTVETLVTEGTSGGGVFDARTGALIGLIQGYWTVRLITAAGQVAGEAPLGTAAVIPLSRVRTVLRDWGLDDLLD